MTALRIFTAYSYDRRNRLFRARAYIGEPRKPWHTRVVAMEETAADAVAQCVKYIDEIYRREQLNPPSEVVNVGRVSAAILDNWVF